jgi:hypothetical protein
MKFLMKTLLASSLFLLNMCMKQLQLLGSFQFATLHIINVFFEGCRSS